jgi:hypothetical protein
MENYSAFKREGILTHATIWMNLEDMFVPQRHAKCNKTVTK